MVFEARNAWNFVQLGRGDAKWAEKAGFRSPKSIEVCPVRRGEAKWAEIAVFEAQKAVMFVQ